MMFRHISKKDFDALIAGLASVNQSPRIKADDR